MSGNLAAVRTGFPVILTLTQDRNHLWGETSSVVAIRGEQPSGPAANKSSDLLKRGDQLPALLCLYHAEHHKRAFGGAGKWLPVTSSKSDFFFVSNGVLGETWPFIYRRITQAFTDSRKTFLTAANFVLFYPSTSF